MRPHSHHARTATRLLLALALSAAFVGGLAPSASAAGTEFRIEFTDGMQGTLILGSSGVWSSTTGSASWCGGGTSCPSSVVLRIPSGEGPIANVVSSPSNPLVLSAGNTSAVSAQGECRTDVTLRSSTDLEGRTQCRDVPSSTGKTVSFRGTFAVSSTSAGSGISGDTSIENPLTAPAAEPGAAHEASLSINPGSEGIHRFAINIVIQEDGSIAVEEEIEYDFGTSDRHGIFRDIPVAQFYDEVSDRILQIEEVSVSSPDAPDDVDLSEAGGMYSIKIGDADVEITGKHTYRITYVARGAMNAFEEHDELYWNLTGDQWGYPIERVEATITAPAEIQKVACYAGPPGSTDSCTSSKVQGATATFTQDGLYPYEGVSAVIALPKGAVTEPAPILRERWAIQRAFSVTPLTVAGALAILAVVLGALWWVMWRIGRDRRAVGDEVAAAFANDASEEQATPLFDNAGSPVDFAPPDGVRPGLLGTLVDGVANPLDVTASIVDLAARGYLRIEEVPKEGIFGKDDYRFVWVNLDLSALLDYEKKLVEGIFQGGTAEVLLSDLRLLFAARLEAVQESLYREVVKQKWFKGRPDDVRTRWRVIGALSFIASALALFVIARFTHAALLGIPLVIGGAILLFGAKWMPQRTAKGTGVVRRALGFRTFITDSEAIRARFAEQQNIFTEYLPYAIVFGCAKKFAKAFEGLEAQMPEQSWYVGSQAFRPVYFADQMSSFAVSTGGTLAATPGSSGSSGFGGGGGSGGGMGGGGGGSW